MFVVLSLANEAISPLGTRVHVGWGSRVGSQGLMVLCTLYFNAIICVPGRCWFGVCVCFPLFLGWLSVWLSGPSVFRGGLYSLRNQCSFSLHTCLVSSSCHLAAFCPLEERINFLVLSLVVEVAVAAVFPVTHIKGGSEPLSPPLAYVRTSLSLLHLCNTGNRSVWTCRCGVVPGCSLACV